MSIKCKIGLHSWDGCKCSQCEKARDEQHDWSKDCEKCSKCGKARVAGHTFVRYKCTQCGKNNQVFAVNLIIKAVESGTKQEINEANITCADLNTFDESEKTPLILNKINDISLLNLAVKKGYIEIAKFLINNKDNKGLYSYLEIAVINGNRELVELLISMEFSKEEIFEASFMLDRLIHIAIAKGNIELVELLISKGVDINGGFKFPTKDFYRLYAPSIDLSQFHYDGMLCNPLNHAVWRNNIEIANLIISKGADVNGFRTSVKIYNPLHFAVENGNLEMAEFLISKGADVNAKNYWEDTPLHISINLESVELLIKNGADVNAKNLDGDTPLHKSKNLESVELLIKNGADVNAKNLDGGTPLHTFGDIKKDVIKVMVDNGADINAKNKYGNTPFHDVKNKDEFKNMLDLGADSYIKNDKGDYPGWAVFEKGDMRVIEPMFRRAVDSNKSIYYETTEFNELVIKYFKMFNRSRFFSEEEQLTHSDKHTSSHYIRLFNSDILGDLASIHTPISNNILHFLTKLWDIEVSLGNVCGFFEAKGTFSYSPVRDKAKEELEKRGNPPYDSNAFLDINAY